MQLVMNPTHVMVTNMSNMNKVYFKIEDWEEAKPMLSDNSVYQYVNIEEGRVLSLWGDINEVN